jgi:protein-disulfide isomerase
MRERTVGGFSKAVRAGLAILVSSLLLLFATTALAQEQSPLQQLLDQVETRAQTQGMVFGNPEGKVTVYKFFDYNCPYCRRAATFMDDMFRLYPEVRLVVIDNAVLGQASRETAIGMSQLGPELRRKAHYDAMAGGRRGAKWISAYADRNDVDIVDPNSADNPVIETIKKDLSFNNQFSRALGFSGVPAFLIGERRIKGLNMVAVERVLCGYDGPGSCAESSRMLFADAQLAEKAGEMAMARSHYRKSAELAPQSKDGRHLNSICWNGAKAGFGSEVMPSCDRAVALFPNYAGYRDSRGLARATTGDFKGAISDIEYWIARNKNNPKQANSLKTRQLLVEAMLRTDLEAVSKLRAQM